MAIAQVVIASATASAMIQTTIQCVNGMAGTVATDVMPIGMPNAVNASVSAQITQTRT